MVDVTILVMTDKKPYTFQVRSKKAFNPGELMLFPCGKLIPKAGNLNPYEDSQAIAKTKYAAKQINNAHISTVPFTVTMSASQGTKQKLKKKARREAG